MFNVFDFRRNNVVHMELTFNNKALQAMQVYSAIPKVIKPAVTIRGCSTPHKI